MKNRIEDRSNKSGNRPFGDVLSRYLSRRDVLRGGLQSAAAAFFASSPGRSLAARKPGAKARPGLMDFTPLPVAGGGGKVPRIAPDYEMQILIPWGEPINPSSGPAFQWPPSAADQEKQVGIGHDGMWFFSLEGSERGLLVLNHEYGMSRHILGRDPQSLDDVRVSQHAHGITIVELVRRDGRWQHVDSRYARRIHVNTPVEFSGPAAGSPLLRNPARNAFAGTLNNCANGHTPWGTYLTCEENIHFYFGGEGFEPSPRQQRYGLNARWTSFHGWSRFDPRFDLTNPEYVNESNRFGWVVEIDPMAPSAPPVKRTALGRFRHEGCAIAVGRDDRVVGYMGDDEQFEYIYKFVSDRSWKALRDEGSSPLDHGRLYAARFDDDGTGEWLELTIDDPRLAAEFADQAEVLMFARRAADIVGATPMDRPEWTTVGPDEYVYCSLTNNSRRRDTNAANPLAPNRHGHIIRWRDEDHHVGTRFQWEIFLIAEETHGTEESLSSPDGLWADPDGRLFIQTDGSGQADGLNDQMLVADTESGELKRLFEGVPGCEVTGIAVTPDRRTMFINVQHPGNGDPAETSFPLEYDGVTIPRDATIAIMRKDGGIVGS